MNKKGGMRGGFTIVELLIVVVVIAILAAITVVAYKGIQNRANDNVVMQDLASAKRKLELAKVDLGRYPQTVLEMPSGFTISKGSYDLTQNNVYYCVDKANDIYAFGVRSTSLKGYIQTSNVGLQEGVTVNGAATCSAIGKTWVNDATTAVMQAYTASTSTWVSSWSWVN